jgi:hypothetical protein
LYAYGNPTVYTDPTGNVVCFGACIAGAVVLAGTVADYLFSDRRQEVREQIQPETFVGGAVSDTIAFTQSAANTVTLGYFDANQQAGIEGMVQHTKDTVGYTDIKQAHSEFTSDDGDAILGTLHAIKGLSQGIGTALGARIPKLTKPTKPTKAITLTESPGNGVSSKGAGASVDVVPDNVDLVSGRRAYLNEKFGRTSDLNADINVRGKKELATNFYLDQGWHPKRVQSHVSGIDFSQQVDVVTLKRGQPLVQYQVGGSGVGNYFAPVGTRIQQLGINPTGRKTSIFAPKERVQVLRSTASEIVDTWSVPGVPYRAEGGGTQFFAGDPDKFRQIYYNE